MYYQESEEYPWVCIFRVFDQQEFMTGKQEFIDVGHFLETWD